MSYKTKIQGLDNRALVKEHHRLHLDPGGNKVNHMVLVAELQKRGLRHIERKGDALDIYFNERLNDLRKT